MGEKKKDKRSGGNEEIRRWGGTLWKRIIEVRLQSMLYRMKKKGRGIRGGIGGSKRCSRERGDAFAILERGEGVEFKLQ